MGKPLQRYASESTGSNTFTARKSLSGPPHAKRSERGRASGSEKRKVDEAHWQRCSAPEISRGRVQLRRDPCVQALFARMIVRSAVPSIFSAAIFSAAVRSAASIAVEDEDVAVLAERLDRFPDFGR
jgi:hypothetical protein